MHHMSKRFARLVALVVALSVMTAFSVGPAAAETLTTTVYVPTKSTSGYASTSRHYLPTQHETSGDPVDCGGDYWVTLRINYSKVTATAIHVTTAYVEFTVVKNYVSRQFLTLNNDQGTYFRSSAVRENTNLAGPNKTYRYTWTINQAIALTKLEAMYFRQQTAHTKADLVGGPYCHHLTQLRVIHS